MIVPNVLLLLAATVVAADADLALPALGDTVVVLPEVRVERERPTSEARRRLPTGFVTEIAAGSRGGALDLLPELLSQAPGVHVTQYGGLGAFSLMTLRAASPAQVAIFLDGTPLTSGAHSVVNLADLPVAAIERIEVYRGVSPLGLGPAGAGGAVNLVTREGTRGPELRVSRGSFDTWDTRGSASLARGPVNGLVLVGYQGSTGDFRYFDDNGTAFNPADDSISTRRNNRFDAVTALASLTWRPWKGVSLIARGDLFDKRQGLAGLGVVPTRHTSLALQRVLGQLELRTVSDGALPLARVRAGFGRIRNRFDDPDAELGLGTHRTDDRFHDDHLDLELEWEELPGALGVQAGGTVRGETARLHDQADGFADPPPSRRDASGVTSGLFWRPLDSRLVLRAANRWDRIEDRVRTNAVGGVPTESRATRILSSPQLGARLSPGFKVELRGNWTKADRTPSFLELFGDGGVVLGNAALLPEHMESWDAGALWTLPPDRPVSASLGWAHFESVARDLITFWPAQGRRARAQNLPRSRAHGEEVSIAAAAWRLRLTASLTWQSVVDVGDVPYWTGRRVPQYPSREHYVRLSWERAALQFGADVHSIGENYLDRYNRARVPGRTLTGAWASFSPRGWPLRITLEGKNLGDQQAADVAGYPLPGRSAFAACETRLGPQPH